MFFLVNSLDIVMEKYQKWVKDENGVVCVIDVSFLEFLSLRVNEVSKQKKFVLVRQVCIIEFLDGGMLEKDVFF